MNQGNRLFHWLLGGVVVFLAGAIAFALRQDGELPINPADAKQVGLGREVYDRYCAACHGAKLEGQAHWRERLPNGRMPAPPHDQTGHTWHHPDGILLGIIKEGLVPGKYAPPGYRSDMPAFGGALTDEEIRAVLAYVKSAWPPDIRKLQLEVDRRSREGSSG